MKKTVGVLMLIVGGFLVLGLIGNFLTLLSRLKLDSDGRYLNSQYLSGVLIGNVLLLVCVFFLIKYGIKFLNHKENKQNIDQEINSIGKR